MSDRQSPAQVRSRWSQALARPQVTVPEAFARYLAVATIVLQRPLTGVEARAFADTSGAEPDPAPFTVAEQW